MDQSFFRFDHPVHRVPRNGDLVALTFSRGYSSFPKSVGRVCIMDQDTLADLVMGKGCLWSLPCVGEFQSFDLRADLVQSGAQVLQDMRSDTIALEHQTEQDMLSANRAMAHPSGLLEGDLDYLLDARSGNDLLDGGALIATEHRLDDLANGLNVNSQVGQYLGGQSFVFAEETKQEVFGADITVMGTLGLFLGEREHLLGALAEPLEWVDRNPPAQG